MQLIRAGEGRIRVSRGRVVRMNGGGYQAAIGLRKGTGWSGMDRLDIYQMVRSTFI